MTNVHLSLAFIFYFINYLNNYPIWVIHPISVLLFFISSNHHHHPFCIISSLSVPHWSLISKIIYKGNTKQELSYMFIQLYPTTSVNVPSVNSQDHRDQMFYTDKAVYGKYSCYSTNTSTVYTASLCLYIPVETLTGSSVKTTKQNKTGVFLMSFQVQETHMSPNKTFWHSQVAILK